MAAPSNNSTGKNSRKLLNHTDAELERGIVIDLGTGDGRFVSKQAQENPHKFYIGIDANAKPLEKISMKATRKPNKGGLPNVLFIQSAVETLPEELNGVADELHVHFPWGSLLRAVLTGEDSVLQSLRRICAPNCLVEIITGIDEERDKSEVERLGIPPLTADYLENILIPKYKAANFNVLEHGNLPASDWSRLETSWARKLQGNTNRKCLYLILLAS